MSSETKTIHCNNGFIQLRDVLRMDLGYEEWADVMGTEGVYLDGILTLDPTILLRRNEFYFIEIAKNFHKVIIV